MGMLKEVVNTLTIGVQTDVALNSKLKIAIWEAQLTNKQLADMVGVTAPNMSNIVNGATPHLKTAQRIVRALNSTGKAKVTIDELWPLED